MLWSFDVGDPLRRSVMAFMLPDGSVGPKFSSDHALAGGVTMSSRTVADKAVVEVARVWAAALASVGAGPGKRAHEGGPDLGSVPAELNGRVAGAIRGRLLLGFDGMAIILREWTGHELPPLTGALPLGVAGSVFCRRRAWAVAEGERVALEAEGRRE